MTTLATLIILYLSMNLFGPSSGDDQPKTAISVKQCIAQKVNIAVGAKDFIDLVTNSDIFFDKTLLIKELLENSANRSIITYPRRTGKTINLSMIKNFVEIQVDENGAPISPIESTTNYKLFRRGEIVSSNGTIKLKDPLLIAKEDRLFELYQGKYPVIYLNFGNMDTVLLKGNFWERINGTIIEAFRQHAYMVNILEQRMLCNKTSGSVKKQIAKKVKIFRTVAYQRKIDDIFCLQVLSEILFEHFNKKVFLLVDGYDLHAYRKVHVDFYMSKQEENTTNFIVKLMNQTFDRNPYMEKAILTGIFQLRDVVWRLWFDKPQKYNLYNRRLFAYYAYTKTETEALFDYLGISEPQREKARLLYNGYRTNVEPDQCFYNPWSVASFINTGKLVKYWSQDPYMDVVYYLFEANIWSVRFRHFMLPLVLGKCLKLDDDKLKFTYEELEILTVHSHIAVPDPRICNFIMTNFFAYGYLTLCNGSYNVDGSIQLRIPNREVMDKFLTGFTRFYYRKHFNLTSGTIDVAIKNLVKFFENNETYSESVIEALTPVFEALPFHYLTPGRTAYLVKDTFEYIVARIQFDYNYRSDVSPNCEATDLVIYKKNRGIILQATSNYTSPQKALEMTKSFRHLFSRIDSVKIIKYIAFNVPMPNETTLVAECEDVTSVDLTVPYTFPPTESTTTVQTPNSWVLFTLPD